MTEKIENEELLDATEACALLKCARSTLGQLVRCGQLTSTRVGNRLRFKREWIDAYIAKNTQEAAP